MAKIVAAVVLSAGGYFDGTLHPQGATVSVDLDRLGIKSLDETKSLGPAGGAVDRQEAADPVQLDPLQGAGQGDEFNPDAIIEGTIEQVAARLSALSNDELGRVEEAEKDREAPRKGVLTAIDEARKARG